MLKAATDNISKAEDENAINQMKDAFTKELDEKMIEFDNDIKTIKESNLILEGVIKNSMIGGRVLLGMIKDKATELKIEYDKKYAEAKDLAAKKASAIEYVKKVVDDSKRVLLDDAKIEELTKKYMADNKIVATAEYKVGDTVIYLRKGITMDKWTALPDDKKKDITSPETAKVANAKKIEKIEGDNYTFTGKDGKQIVKTSAEIISKVGEGVELAEAEKLKTKLAAMKDNPEQMKKVATFTDFISKPENAAKYAEVEKIIAGDATAPE
jgi:hypothetical protein